MDKYLEAEKKLAELLGWQWKEYNDPAWQDVWIKPDGKWSNETEKWTRDDAAAFRLMVEHFVNVDVTSEEIVAYIGRHVFNAHYYNHPDKDTAVRYAIVQAVIAKLERAES